MMNIDRLGHDGTRIQSGDLSIYIDPYQISSTAKADIILITHGHFDHLSPDDIKKILKSDTAILCPPGCEPPAPFETISAGETKTVKGIQIEAVPAYNVNKKFHPKAEGHVGYIVTVDGQRIYHAGDTDVIPEMSGIKCDVALLPVSGTYVMTAEEAVEAATIIRPKTAIPMHYDGGVVGSIEDAQTFERLLQGSGIDVEITDKID
ncbi:MAG: MBL fold metallo-hydrolase [Myxococcota bacterium]|nr:MBL fold metallo-hydrolase [Myxococcota bacterium]